MDVVNCRGGLFFTAQKIKAAFCSLWKAAFHNALITAGQARYRGHGKAPGDECKAQFMVSQKFLRQSRHGAVTSPLGKQDWLSVRRILPR